ncbi:DUF6985 domain-containing protein [Chryseobacterium kwangjuense]|uniref:DUF6985 domain-containing protein n=1 Tax=Chryseobacterium kwangjuense TaxID=267125 RepID=A0A135WLL7_9FLAO|nr:hypothetical protein [Chryseobacterium kwangjuense]KXH85808.1 hypothetical protein AU378_08720 [Chryseobacterium kwangjuense]
MSKEIISKVIGPLQQDEDFPDWWKNTGTEIPFFNHEQLDITFMDFEPEHDAAFIEEADQALANFLQLTVEDRKSISELVYKNCMDFLEAVGYDEDDEPLWEIKDHEEIWNFVYPSEILVSRRHRRDQKVYVQIACSCEWEQEHGLQLVFREGKQLTRVSSQDGHLTEADAYDKPDSEDELLSGN